MPENLELLHKSSIYAVVAAGFFALASSGRLGLAAMGLFSVAAIGSWFLDAAGWTNRDHVPWWNGFVGVCLVLSVGHIGFLGASVLMATVRFLLLLTAVRLVTRDRVRDELQLYALAFLMMAAGAALNDDVTYGIAFAAFVLTGTFSLALFHLKREFAGRTTATFRSVPFDRRYVTVLGGLSVAIFAVSLVLFVGFPRVGLGFFETDSREGVQVSGFSDSVELGSHGISRDNPEVALRIEFPDGRPDGYERLHWRTLTFDRYDGLGWQRTLSETEPRRGLDVSVEFARQYGPEMPEGDPDDVPARVDMYVEPLESDVLPTLWPTESVKFGLPSTDAPPGSPRAGSVGVDAYGDLSHSVASSIGVPYSLRLRARPQPAELREARPEMPPEGEEFEPFLQLPRSMEQIEQLARRVTEDADAPYERARAIEQYFQSEFTYTTDLPSYGDDRPVQNFLFETRRGHCEYYATAMVLMLRTLDIPARLVNGFLGGEWNSVGDYLAVRQQDAHSWVEFHLPGFGWIPMDPTPVAPILEDESSPLDWFRESYDALQMAWFQWIIEYDLDAQLQALRKLSDWADAQAPGDGGSESPDDSEEGASNEWRPFLHWGGLIVLGLVSLVTARRFDARFERWKFAGNGAFWSAVAAGWSFLFVGFELQTAVAGGLAGFGGAALGAALVVLETAATTQRPTQLFQQIEHAARAAGIERRAGEPPAAYLRRLATACPELVEPLQRFRQSYLRARFGGRSLDPENRRGAERAAASIREGLRDRAGRSD